MSRLWTWIIFNIPLMWELDGYLTKRMLRGLKKKYYKISREELGEPSIGEVLEWCSESIEMEGNVSEEILIEKLKSIYDFLYLKNNGNYYLITYPNWFELLNKYREKMGEEYTNKILNQNKDE